MDVLQGFRLSPQQRRVWLLQRDSRAYQSQCAISIDGPLDVAVLKETVQRLIERHEILRTTFECLPGMKIPVQVTADEAAHSLCEVDFSEQPVAERSSLVNQLFDELRLQDQLGVADRYTLVRLSPVEHVLLISLPALCADKQTLNNLLGEITRLYQQSEELEETVQYAQFSAWQHELLEENDGEAGHEFWRKQSSFTTPLLKLPLESSPTEISTFAPRTHTLTLADDTSTGVFLLTCWQSLLRRLTKQDDIAIRYLCNGRVYEEMSDAFGIYDRWPLLHSQFQADEPFTKVLEQIDRTVTDAREWQEYYPGGDEVDESIGFDFTEQPAACVAGGLTFSITRQYSCTERMKLRLSCTRTENALIAEFHYDPTFYSESVIENLAGQFRSLVRSATTRPESTISELEIVGEQERQKLLVEWNATQTEFERDGTIQQLFETQAALTPDALALLYDDQKLTFHELNCRANQLARHLQSLGVNAETPVALCVERSLEMIVGLLGILKAGGAYVPLDAAQPSSRLSFMLEDAHVGVLLTQESLNGFLPAHNARAVCLDTAAHAIAQHDSSNLPSQTTAQNLAYMIYTSGSTGRPKGTMIEHRSVINLLGALKRTVYADVDHALRVSVNAPLAFDSSVKQVIQLLSGHSLCVIPEEVRRDGERMLRYLAEHKVDVLDCTPSQLRLLLSSGLGTYDQLAVRRVLVGGEAIDAALWQELSAQDSVAYFNVYGPTECTVDTTVSHIGREQIEPALGRAISNVQVYLLDEQQQLVPIGMTGELCIGGEGVGRGYHDRADLTAEKFVPDPFSLKPGARLYRTGDAARYTATGELEYNGRLDGQVKIRGSRIELGEVEVALSAHPSVQTCAVIAREDAQGGARLVAYAVLHESESSSVKELRAFLSEKLPDYMIPSVVMLLEEMPLTPNGKINRQALPAPGQMRPDLDEAFTAPRTPGEGILAGMWEHLLGVERVGINDDFFELGGHSLLAMQLISRVREAFQIEIPLPALFAAPTVATLAVRIEEIIKAGDGLLAPPIRPVPRTANMPLSFAQMRLWFLHQLDPASVLYNLPLTIRLRGGVNVAAMERTLTEIVRRHEVLRTTYATSGGQPIQVINPPQPFSLPVVDLSALPVDQREEEARRLAMAEAMRPFNLSEGPLMRATFLALDEDEYLALFTMHHITSDGWSMGLLTREVAVLYEAFAAGASSPLPELPVQYADFAQWQRNWLRGEVLDAHLDFWKQQLDGAPPVHQLPTVHPRPAIPTYRGSNLPLTLSAEVTATLKALSREEGVTLFMTLLAAFQTLLYRYSGQPDVVVGTGIANRNRAEVEGLLGFFVNSLVLRTDLSGNPTFRELLARVREVTLGAYAHQEMPFEVLVEALQPERNLNYNPLFQVMVILQNTPRKASGVSGLSLRSREVQLGTSKFDLYLVISEGDHIDFGLEYTTDLFDEATIQRMLSHFNNLFEAICADPDTRVQELSLLSAEESRHLLCDFNPPAPALPPAICLHQLFEAHAAVSPKSPAISFDGFHLTNEKVNARANRLAHHLRSLGVGPEDRVAVMLDRTPDLVVAILGILKAGAAYLPLDPAYPQERLSFMLADAGAQVVVTEQALVERWLLDSQATLVCLDDQVVATAASINLSTAVRAENAAYVIYTSGSTGRPKGVVVTHENVWRLMEVTRADFGFDERDVWTLFHSVSFDFSVWELWGPLAYGGRLVVVPYWVSREPEAFYELLKEERVTVLNQTPSAFRQLMKVDEAVGAELALQVVVFGGEALEMSTLRGWFERHGDERPRLVNMYGITETTVHVTYRELSARDTEGGSVIGDGLADLEVYVLDQQMRAVPEGVTGEMYVGGGGVARGYLGRAELTAQRFVPHPYSERAGARLYRTGDLARRRGDGELEYLGRMDEQVKIRGFRIELGEIANALREQVGVRECVVLALGEGDEEKRIVAYVVADEGVNAGELREELKQRLPEHMIPSAIVLLEEMPLTRNGKVDRKALPAPEEVWTEEEENFVAPRTPVEEVLAGIWCDVLRTSRVGVNDNFFELGGHSLLATQVISRIREAFSIEIPVRSIFEKPTLAMLAAEVEQLMNQGGSLQAPPVVRTSRDVELPLSFAQQRLWFIDRLTPGSPLYNMPVAVRLNGALNLDALAHTLREIVRRHEVLRTNFATVEGKPVQVIRPEAYADEICLPLIDLSSLPAALREAEAKRLAQAEAAGPFDLETGALLRMTVLRLDDQQHIALLTFHHIVSDGWSMGVFVKEVAALYNAFSQGLESPLAELPVQYGDYAVWQREWLQGEVLEQQIGYWKQQLEGAPGLLELPTDRPRPVVPTHRGARVGMVLTPQLTAQLRELCRAEGATLFMVLLAALKVLLARYTGQSDISVGTPIAGRNRVETEGLIGFFINTLVLRTELSGQATVRELIRRVREVALGAYAHQELPFEKLVDELQVERSLSHTPFFQVVFALQNTSQELLELPGLSLSAAGEASGVAKYDLTLNVGESGDAISGVWEYNTDLFDETTIQRMLSHFHNLLQAICADPDTRVQELSLLSAEESRHLLSDFNPPAPALPPAVCMHQLFEAQAERAPKSLALSCDGFNLSYGEVNERANRLAHHLRSLGVGPEDRVAVMLDRTPDLVIAVLGILKAGAAYLPLDPAYPQERLSFMLQDAGAQVVVTEQALVERWLLESQAPLVCLDDQVVATAASTNLSTAVRAENAAYVIYTSGSTGRPKGVVVTHENVWRLMEVTQADFQFDSSDVWTLFHSVSFDFSVWELWGPLAYGGRLVVVPYWVSREPEAFYELLREERVTVLNQTPSAFRQLIKVDETVGAELALRTVIFGGEALEMSTLRGWFERHGDERPRLVNMYGITETTVHVTYRELSARDIEGGSVIGGPLGDLDLYVLDQQMRAVPEGVTGEMYVGGGGVARGYLGRAELTAQRFVPHPYSEREGARLYRTGDLARRRGDGELEYLGRMDEQVKIRGFRIELGEIANALREQAGVNECVVLALGAGGEEKRIVAYVVADQEVNAGELREELKQRLPEHMIPSAIVMLDEMPLTRNGKVDRRALPAPEDVSSEVETNFVAPRTPFEEVLAGIWCDVLRTNRIDVNEDFFAAGGNSLLATQVVSRIREAFSIEIPVRSIFEKPTVAMLAAEVEQLMNQGGSLQAPPVVRRSREGELPLSFAQQRLWFIDRLTPGSPIYNMPMAVRLDGALNLDALAHTFREIVRRHELLRTNFGIAGGQPTQVIRPEAYADEFCLPLVDLSSLPAALREAEAKRLARAETSRPFDLEMDSLLRTTVLRLDDQQHIALLTFHHIVSDGWSMGVLVKEVAALYNAFSQGLESPLAELPVQYADYAGWQREWLQGEVLEQQIGYWKRQLEDAPGLLELPTDRPRPAVQTHRGARVGMVLSPELTTKVRELCRTEGATLFMVLLAALKVLLARYTGQSDISVGTLIAGRNRVETEGLIGFFINTLVLRTELSGQATVRELIRRVREVALGAYAHQELPFEKLVDELQVERSLSHTPFFQVLFQLQNAGQELLELPGLSLSAAGEASGVAKYDLTLNVGESGDAISGVWEYNTDLFDEATVQRMLSHFQNLLQAICADPDTRVQELSLLSSEESRHLLSDFNPPAPALPPAICMHQLFEKHAALEPESPAVSFDGFNLSYGKVNERANRLAHHLRSLGVGPEDRIAVMLDRTPDLVIAILGILKAGAAYLPLDPAYPQERLSYMLTDAGAQVVVTEQALVERWLLDSQATLVCLDDQVVATAASTNLSTAVRAENAAYVIYTSGSTGRPKGVVVTHENVWRLMEVTQADFQFDERDVWTLFHSVSFDFSVWELWGPLAYGGRLVVVPYWVSREPEAFYELLKEERVTVLNQTPSAFRQLMKVDEVVGAELALRTVIFGGEALEMSTLRGWFERHGDESPRLVNMYGITETTVHVTYRELSARDTEGGSVIGDGLADLEVYVLDPQMRAVPEGVTGEMYVGGGGVARGYLGRAELTAQRFVPHPYSEREGARLYRTGDLARRRADGELEYLGRMDEQVKIRGFRIELGEIANALREQGGVRECVVLALGEGSEEKRLVAYVVADEGVNAGELREELKQRLPEHMIPSAIVLLAEMPLTRNGKVDRKALPAPEEVWNEAETDFVAPRTPAEEVLAGIWCDVLRTNRVGVNDNFFELGGHSLLATQVISRIREAFSIELPVRAIFEKPTVAMLATEVEQLMYQGGSLYAPPIQRTSRDVELPLSFAQQRLWFIDRLTPESPLYNMPFAVRLDGDLNLDALVRTFREIVRRHEVLRTNIVTVEGKPTQVIRPEAYADEFYLPLIDLSSLPAALREAEVRRLAHAESVRPFDLAAEPLMRTTVLRQDVMQHIALLTFHHIIFDGWSMGVFVKEVAALYNAFSQGQSSSLTELPVQYADYAVWQREWLQGEVLEQHIGYWKRQLEGAPELLELPTDRPRPAVQTHRGASVGMVLSPELTTQVRELCRAEGATLFMVLLAALKVLLARYTGQEDISVGTPIAGRNRVETEGLIGFFVNTLVLRTELSGQATVRELIRRVREVALGAYAHQELPFEKLVDELQVERSLSHSPLFQVVFTLQNTSQELLELPGLSLSAAGEASDVAKFDLTLSMSESDETISGALHYNTDLFDEATIKRLLGHFETLLESFVSDPGQRLSQLQMLTEAELQRMLYEWGESEVSEEGATSTHRCLQDLFEAQVERKPEAIALEFDGKQISYRELNDRANQLAHYLQSVGVREESLVGVLVQRSVEMLVGIAGVLKAGAAYLPLDPSYPQERLSFMLADAGVEVLLTQRHLAERFASASLDELPFQAVCLDSDWPHVAEHSTDNPARNCVAANAAYVIYTSGSTGKPKGVVVTHEGALNLADAQRRALDVQPGTRVLQAASLSFDASVWELLVSVMCGATLCVPKPETQMAGDALRELLQQQAIELCLLTPTVLATVESNELPCLRTVVTGGEACSAELAARWSDGRRLVNAYGPTEITVIATMSEPLDGERLPPIGRPIANMQAYVLDKYMQPVAVGVAGELYVGGIGVTRGYLHRPELTAERFVPHPFSLEAGTRLYRTGDIVRYLADGQLEYVGRVDEQVKVRGLRIELNEIEAVLLQHEKVREAVVVVRAVESNERRIVAYLVNTHDASPLTTSELRLHAKQYLPEYMVPSAFVQLESLPLTPIGKVDKKRLPAPSTERPSLTSEYVKPQTETEQRIAAVWQELLHLSEVGTEDNFFDLGGNSLLLVQLHARLQKILGEQLKMVDLFEHPTIGSLAAQFNHEAPSPAQAEREAARFEKVMTGKQRQRQRLEQRRRALKKGDLND